MHPVNFRPTRRKTVLALALALGVGTPTPAQAYLLDLTVTSISLGGGICSAGSSPSRPPPVGGRPRAAELNRRGGRESHLIPTDTVLNKLSNFPTGPLADYLSPGASAPGGQVFAGRSPRTSIRFPVGLRARNLSDDPASSGKSFETASLLRPATSGAPAFFSLPGSHYTGNPNDCLLAPFGIFRQTIDDNFHPDSAARFAAAPGASMRSGGNILHHFAPFTSTLLLLGSGLMGLVGLRHRRRRG